MLYLHVYLDNSRAVVAINVHWQCVDKCGKRAICAGEIGFPLLVEWLLGVCVVNVCSL